MYRSTASLAAARRLVARSASVVPRRATLAAAAIARVPAMASSAAMRPALASGFHSSTVRCGGAGGDSAAPGSTVPFLLADIGEGITECEITQWFVKEGDAIAQFDKICEVQSDKAAVEISSRFDGTITKLHYKVGDMAKVGAPLIDIKLDGDAPAEAADVAPAASAPEASSTPGPTASSAPTPAPSSLPSSTPIASSSDRVVFATPAVRRIAREHNIDLRLVPATGKGDRILKEDVLRFIESGGKVSAPSAKPAASTPTPSASPVATTPTSAAGDELRALTTIQKAMFKSMSKSLTIPHFGYADELRLDAIMKVRDAVNRSVKASPKGTYPFSKVSYMPFFIKSFSLALQQFPLLNAQLVYDTTLPADQAVSSAKLLYRPRHNVSIAMDTPAGLIVPNIKDVQSKSIFDIAADLHRLQEAGKKGAIPAADLKDGTITLSNIGAIGGTYMGPVVVTSEVCIAALGKTQRLPRYKNEESNEVEPHHIMPVSFSADHRVVDGASVARFVQVWKQYLENPMSMLAAMK